VKATLVNKMMPAENVAFDFNPEKLTVKRGTSSSNLPNASPSGPGGSTPSVFRGSRPRTLTGEAFLEGDDVQDRGDQLMSWMEPYGGLLGKAAGAALGALSMGRMNLSAKLPVLIFSWGPFLMECVAQDITVVYERFDSSGAPTRGRVSFTLKEEPSLLGMLPTNPTSGGLPGRKRHVVSQGDTLALIAAHAYGHPGHWRAIADANGIDDPLRLVPGRVLLLPSPGELAEART
jgi:nucleoid-associated protein YgaU